MKLERVDPSTDRVAGEAMSATSLRGSILVVDDDPKSRMALRELLADMGLEVTLADSGEEALRCVLKQDFAAILMDARMPGVDGFEAAGLMRRRERSRHTPIIFLTGAYEDAPSVARGYEAGAVDYIVKPPVPEILKSKIAVFVSLHGKNAELTREIAERRRIEEHLRSSEENLRALAAHLQHVREEEWRRIAREIHDEFGQILTGLKMDLKWIADALGAGQSALGERAKAMSARIDEAVRSVRGIATRLRPEALDELGLPAAIEWQASEFQRRTGVRCVTRVSGATPELDGERSIAAFRIFQELLTNVARHAGATRVDVALGEEDGDLVLTIEDDGRGIDQAAVSSRGSLGLLGMRERALQFGGTVEIA
ncbi:MAG: ATP-binding response regulator, partial [Burkholderiales bacterium]